MKVSDTLFLEISSLEISLNHVRKYTNCYIQSIANPSLISSQSERYFTDAVLRSNCYNNNETFLITSLYLNCTENINWFFLKGEHNLPLLLTITHAQKIFKHPQVHLIQILFVFFVYLYEL